MVFDLFAVVANLKLDVHSVDELEFVLVDLKIDEVEPKLVLDFVDLI